ncbi:hypothetical protein DPMN_111643 [Dreissena polymorpha]|uniref:Uncharacterized protein n=1 Tax=Dreissena polymorpha TaxID=45954 RepID=A0A9D4KE92_DREPO|nr:hypothetical protein DPMN_111643 [Dreissena polymorpha]
MQDFSNATIFLFICVKIHLPLPLPLQRNGRLQTDLYTKPTDELLYLHRGSSHPESTKRHYHMVWMCVRKESVQRRLPTGSTDRR